MAVVRVSGPDPLQACESALLVALESVYRAEDRAELAGADASELRDAIRGALDVLSGVA